MSAYLTQMGFILLGKQWTHQVASAMAFLISGELKTCFQGTKEKLIIFHCYKFSFQGSRQLQRSKALVEEPGDIISVIHPTPGTSSKSLYCLLRGGSEPGVCGVYMWCIVCVCVVCGVYVCTCAYTDCVCGVVCIFGVLCVYGMCDICVYVHV